MPLSYFAYGSNMLHRRLQERVASAVPLGVVRLDGHILCWHKRGMDGSGKCDARRTGDAGDRIWGVLYEMDESDIPVLDRYEGTGKGYDRVEVTVDHDGEAIAACTYVAIDIDPLAKPYDWYKAIVLAGAKQNDLPDDHIAAIKAVESVGDPDGGRRGKAYALLPGSGISHGQSPDRRT